MGIACARWVSFAALLLAAMHPGVSQVLLSNPSIPDHETLTYSKTVAGKVSTLKVSWDLVREKSPPSYEVRAISPEQDALFRLDSHNLATLSSEVVSRSPDATLRRSSAVLENRARLGEGELLVGSYESFAYELRGFPWGRVAKARLVFLGAGSSGGSGFNLDLTVLGKESVEVLGHQVSCWKAQLGLSGVFGAFIGKTLLWYSADPPHYLVRSEGSSGPPGSPMASLLLVGYGSSSEKP